jgi:hypothetical protein
MALTADIPLETNDGKAAALGDLEGKALVIVNVAGKCGFTLQYAAAPNPRMTGPIGRRPRLRRGRAAARSWRRHSVF